SSANFATTVTAQGGFSAPVSLTMNGLPTGATALSNPTSLIGSGTITASVVTSAGTPVGTYPITITGTGGSLTHSISASLVVTPLSSTVVETGYWTTLPYQTSMNPVHAALMHNGKVLIVSGSGWVAGNTNYLAEIWDPATGLFAQENLTWDMWCNGTVILPD